MNMEDANLYIVSFILDLSSSSSSSSFVLSVFVASFEALQISFPQLLVYFSGGYFIKQ